MAQEEKKDGKQVVLPYDEYQEMARKIAENSFELSVKLRYEDDYPIATLKDIVSNGNSDEEIKATFRRVFSDILHQQSEWVYGAKRRIQSLEQELYGLRQNKWQEHRLSRELSDLAVKNNQLKKDIAESRRSKTEWKGIATEDCLDEMFANMPFVIYDCRDNDIEAVCQDDWRGDIEKHTYYTHWKPIITPITK